MFVTTFQAYFFRFLFVKIVYVVHLVNHQMQLNVLQTIFYYQCFIVYITLPQLGIEQIWIMLDDECKSFSD